MAFDPVHVQPQIRAVSRLFARNLSCSAARVDRTGRDSDLDRRTHLAAPQPQMANAGYRGRRSFPYLSVRRKELLRWAFAPDLDRRRGMRTRGVDCSAKALVAPDRRNRVNRAGDHLAADSVARLARGTNGPFVSAVDQESLRGHRWLA